MRRTTLGLASLALLGLGVGWYVFSPLWTLKQMRAAADARAADDLAAHVDLPALREDLKSELSVALVAQARHDKSGAGALGAAVGLAMLDTVVDGFVSPAGIRLMFASAAGGDASPGGRPPARMGSSGFRIERDGLAGFRVLPVDPTNGGALVFRRYGLEWRLAGVDLPPDAFR